MHFFTKPYPFYITEIKVCLEKNSFFEGKKTTDWREKFLEKSYKFFEKILKYFYLQNCAPSL